MWHKFLPWGEIRSFWRCVKVTIVRHIWFKSCWTSLKKHFVTFSILQYLPPLKLLHFPYWTSKIQYNLIKFTSFDVDFLIFQITKLQIFFAQSLCFCYLGPPVGVKAWKRHQTASLNHSFCWGAHRVRAAVAQIVLVVRKLLLVSEWWKVEGCETSNCWSELKGCYCCCQRFSWQQSYFKTKHL